MRLKCPWAGAVEWTGAFSDNDTVWTNEFKKKFNSMNQLDGYSDNDRYLHRWNVEDGIFVMKIEDFLDTFNNLVVCRDFPDNFYGIKFED